MCGVTKMGPWLASCGSFGQVQMCGGHVGGDRRQSWPFELIWKSFLALKVPMDGHFKVLSVKPEKKLQKNQRRGVRKPRVKRRSRYLNLGVFGACFGPKLLIRDQNGALE